MSSWWRRNGGWPDMRPSYLRQIARPLDARATQINEPMKLAAAHAIASDISDDELHPEYIVPSVFDKRVGELVARRVAEAAHVTGVARRR